MNATPSEKWNREKWNRFYFSVGGPSKNRTGSIFQTWMLLVLCAAWVGALYLQSAWIPWLFDDYLYIVDNPYIRGLRAVGYAFAGPHTAPNAEHNYRPLLLLTYTANYLWDGLRPLGFHLVNAACHAVTGWLLWRLLRQLGTSVMAAAVIAGLWLAHPAHVHAVAYVAGRSSVLVTLWCVSALVVWTRQRSSRSAASTAWATLAYALALMSKENAIVLPVALLAYDVVYAPRQLRRLWQSYLPILGVSGVYWWWRLHLFGGQGAAPPPGYLLAALAQWPGAWIAHLRDWAWPVRLPFLRDEWLLPSTAGQELLVLLALGLGVTGAWRARRAAPGLLFGGAWCVLTGLPTDVLPLSFPTATHHLYLIGIGAAVMAAAAWIAWGAAWMRRRRWLVMASVTVLALWWGALAIAQQIGWQDEVALWRREVERTPASLRARGSLAAAMSRRPGDAARRTRAYIASVQSLMDELIRTRWSPSLRTVPLLRPPDPASHAPHQPRLEAELAYYHGHVALAEGREQDARAAFDEAMALDPSFAPAYASRAQLALRRGDDARARALLSRIIALEPWNAEAHFRLGLIAGRAGDPRALAHFQRAVAYDARLAAGYYNLAVTYTALDPPQWDRARTALARAQALGYAADPAVVDRIARGASGAR